MSSAASQSSASPSLDGCFTKLTRAEEHIGQLRAYAERDTPLATLTKEIEFDKATQTLRATVRVTDLPAFPRRLSVLIGDAVQNIRSALDYLVYELIALEAGGSYWEDSQFPIALSASGHTGRRDTGTIKRLGRHWQVIAAYQRDHLHHAGLM